MSLISIVTINIEFGKRNRNKIKETSYIIAKNNPDIIFIQEYNKHSIDLNNNYEYIKYLFNNDIAIFLNKKSDWKQHSIYIFDTIYSYTKRTCKVIYLKNIKTNKIIKLANVHLCGGRFDENDNIGGMLLGSIKDIRKRKNEILDTLINEYNIDIIAGDFNSDLIAYMKNELSEHHLKYFNKISPNTKYKILLEWNIAPYKFLKKKIIN